MNEVFNDILQKDEKIINAYKPNKKSFYRARLVPFLIFPTIIIPIICIALIIPAIIIVLCLNKAYNNAYYCYTNKRLIVRKGVFGISFDSLKYKDITSASVDVGLLDKGINTGNLTFKSPSVHSTHSDMPRYFTFNISKTHMP